MKTKFPLVLRREPANLVSSHLQVSSRQPDHEIQRDATELARAQHIDKRDTRIGEDRDITPDHITDFDRQYGSDLTPKGEKHIRLMTSNIHHFPLERVSADRYDQLKHEVQTNQYDVIGLTETNYNWSRLPDTDQIHHQTRGW